MITNNDDISSWKNLPADLRVLLSNVQDGTFPYPERESDWAQMQDYLQNGNHSMATFKLEQMLMHQNSLRQGIPDDLLQLINTVQAGATEYPNRESDWAQMQDYLQNGNHSMATFKLEQMLMHQNSLRQGIPDDLLQLINTVQAGATEYPNRESDWAQMQDYLQNGNHSMATFKLEQMLMHQNSLRQGIPDDLLQLINTVQAGATEYPNRESDWAQMQDYLQNGNHSMATFKLEQMLMHQNSLRQGIPDDLLQLINAVQAGATEYPNRESDWAQMQDYLQNGNHSMATFKLEQMLMHQINLRG